MTKARDRLRLRHRFALCAGAAAGGLMVVRLFVPSPVGMADNGDGFRRMCSLDVVTLVPPGVEQWLKFAHFTYTRAPQDGCDPAQVYPSSGNWLLRAAEVLSNLLGFPGVLDLRALAVLFCVLIAGAFTLFAAALRGSVLRRAVVCALLFLVVADSAFAGYAASPYGELAGLTGMVWALAGAVHLGGKPAARLLGLLACTAGAVVAVASKTQSATMAVPFVMLLALARVPLGGWRAGWRGRIAPALAALVIIGAAVGEIAAQPGQFRRINPTEMVFVGLLPRSDDPREAAVDLGLPADFARYAGRSWWVEEPPHSDPRWAEYEDRMTYGTIASFLVTHPAVTARVAYDALDDFGAARPDYLGSYQPEAGLRPGAQESRLALFSTLVRDVGGGLMLALVTVLGAVAVPWWRRTLDPRRRAFVATVLCAATLTWVQFLTAVYGEAIENTKHLVFAVLSSGLTVVMAVAVSAAGAGSGAGTATGRREGDAGLDPESGGGAPVADAVPSAGTASAGAA
ncbi:glycan biosynthesis hexose transferase WsfD [Streptomyces hydrogenans]|uniref:glycan biosynthesis hexose transferase WsfD n=1 Tax=Streptomyces hydrogenans TaxID=1873719 RepID=UPI0035D5F887